MLAIVHEVAEKYQDKAAGSLLTIHVDATPNLPKISGDPKSLERALTALVDNAIKFSPHGGQVDINLREEDNNVVIDVKDQGIGIETERISHIFDRFYRIEKSGENLFGGIGLGLAITNQVIKQHNGRISIQSEPDKGSTFSVRLKATKVMF
jgi:signal transduction histidine kinase